MPCKQLRSGETNLTFTLLVFQRAVQQDNPWIFNPPSHNHVDITSTLHINTFAIIIPTLSLWWHEGHRSVKTAPIISRFFSGVSGQIWSNSREDRAHWYHQRLCTLCNSRASVLSVWAILCNLHQHGVAMSLAPLLLWFQHDRCSRRHLWL